MKKFISILAISAFTVGLVVVAAPANARRDCYHNNNTNWSALENSNGEGKWLNHTRFCD